jgi:Mitochondrial ribosomal protein L27
MTANEDHDTNSIVTSGVWEFAKSFKNFCFPTKTTCASLFELYYGFTFPKQHRREGCPWSCGKNCLLEFLALDCLDRDIDLTMVRPSSAHWARLPLTTKQVNGGYYKGNRTGSMGAHTEWGGYVIDYRKVRNFNCPDLENNKVRVGHFASCHLDLSDVSTVLARRAHGLIDKGT